MMRVLLIIVFVALGIPAILYLAWIVHCAMDWVCVTHARRFCKRRGLEMQRVRLKPAFDSSGIKTESTLVQLDCSDAKNERRLVLLLVWPFGVRRILNEEKYPESFDSEWPQPDN